MSSTLQTGSDAATDGSPPRHPLTEQHLYGEYDEDDSPTGSQRSDNDNDDFKATDRDNDSDNPTNSYFDKDDKSVFDFGHAADASDRRAISTLIKSYYAAAAAADGAKACALIYPSLARTLPEDLAEAGPAYLHGTKTCPRIMSKLFEQYHPEFAAYAAKLQIVAVRLMGKHGLVVLAFKPLPARQIEVQRSGKAWKIYAVVDQELP